MTAVETLSRVGVAAFAATLIFLSLPAAGEEGPRRLVIEIENFAYAAPDMAIRPGDTVVFVNRDLAPHTATANDGSWDTGLLKQGESFELTITAKTAADYFCRFHPAMTAALKLAR